MIDITKLPDDILIAIRGATEATDEEITNMTPKQIIQYWSQWHLGSRGWADSFLRVWQAANKAEEVKS